MDKGLAEPAQPPGPAGDNLNNNKRGAQDEQIVSTLITSLSSLIKQRNFQDAFEECDKALEQYPYHEKLLEKKIKILCHQGRFDEAYILASQWLQREPKHPIALKELKRLKIVIEALRDQDSDEETKSEEKQEEEPAQVAPPQTSAALLPEPPAPVQSNTLLVAAGQERKIHVHGPIDDDLTCSFCEMTFPNQEELEAHCRSDSHKKNITSDDSQAWKYRPPPRGLGAEDYSLCQRYADTGRCPFADKCTQAHSVEELEEWKERFKYKRQQIQMAKDKRLHGNTYPEQLLEKLMTAEYPKSVMVGSVEYAKVIVNSDLNVSMVTKKCTNAWTFTVTSKICILRVVLLDEASANYFYISSISVGPKKTQKYQNLESLCQEWKNPDLTINKPGEYVYRVKVVFKTDIYGTFRQSLVFDFGSEPVLCREMQVESAPVTNTEQMLTEFKMSEQGRWRSETVTVVDYRPRSAPEDAISQALLFKYSLPVMDKFRFSEHLMQLPTKDSYRLWMHQMLYVEELAQLDKISKFNITSSLQLVNRFLLMPGALSSAKFAHDGELFGRMKLEEDVSLDSVEGRLIFQSSSTVWIAPHSASRKPHQHPTKVYEALVEDRGKNFVFLRLSSTCVSELGLSSDQEFEAEIQFQLNRLPLCEMHSAVDALPTLDLVFPAVEAVPQLQQPTDWEWKEDITTPINEKQKEAIKMVAGYSNTALPPVLIVGPFGTGKTYTLAQAVKQVLELPGSKILLCTHSNSAADLYIKDFLHPYVMEGNLEARPLRVLYRHRWIQTVPETVLQYCIQESAGPQLGTFRAAQLEDLEKHRIVITTLSTARQLSDLSLPKGYFTHIFLDEAAQALECETLIPLSLVGPKTRLVLAGDHMQMSPEVFSDFGRQQEFHKSLLERLFDMYPDSSPCKVMLQENYRSNAAIVEFTSELFYDHKLKASLDPASHGVYYPLTFFTARGEETQHENSSAYFNTAEIYEVVEQVEHLYKHWPPAWGEFNENSICVVAPYTDQVIRIRSELRARKLYKVSVERVVNIQGKQFRVVMLSAVRTRHTCGADGMSVDKLDLGFLSNIKLLNTAITRAQSLVVVIGDPVSMCLVGKCSKVWEYYLEVCNEHNSFFGMTWPHLRSLLNNVEMTKTYILNPLAPEFIPKSIFMNSHQGQPVFMSPDPYSAPLSQPPRHRGNVVHAAPYQPVYPHPAYVPMMYPYHPYIGPGPMVYRPHPSMYPAASAHFQGKGLHKGAGIRYSSSRGRYAVPVVPKEEVHVEHGLKESPKHEGSGKKVHASKTRMLYVPRMPVPYHQPYYPYPQYIMPEDPRLMGPVQPPYFYNYGMPRPYVMQQVPVYPAARPGSGSASPASSTEGTPRNTHHVSPDRVTPTGNQTADVRPYSPALSPGSTMTGQQIQLLPNVKHVPLHLLTNPSGSEENSRSSTPRHTNSPAPPQSPLGRSVESPRHFPTEPENYRKRHHSGPRPVSQSPSFSSQSSHESSASPVLNGDSPVQAGAPIESKPSTNLKFPHHLKLNTTGFSRQFSDELGTPTEITNLVKMIEENIEEEGEEEEDTASKIADLRFQLEAREHVKPTPPAGKLYLNLTTPGQSLSQPSSESSLEDDSRPTYAGALGRQLPAVHSDSLLEPVLLEPQTPMTPAGFMTPGTDFTEDPLEILRNLTINNDSLNRSAHGHF